MKVRMTALSGSGKAMARSVRVQPVLLLALVTVWAMLCPESAVAQNGGQTPTNRFLADYTPVYSLGFESPLPLWLDALGQDFVEGAEAIEGDRSAVIAGTAAVLTIPAAELQLEPGRTYIVEYDYVVRSGASPDRPDGVGGTIFFSETRGQLWSAWAAGPSGKTAGRTRTGLRIGASADVGIQIVAVDADVVVDNIRIWRQNASVKAEGVRLWTHGFPRLANYSIFTPRDIAVFSGVDVDEVESILSRYDVLLGTDIDHTLGAGGWVSRIRQLNPDIRILPYKQSYMASDLGRRVVDGNADLIALFNSRLRDEWFMKNPDGELLNEPNYPEFVQLDHTIFPPGEFRLEDYVSDFVAESVLSSGLWDGIHFDQPEWIPNPLLNPIGSGLVDPPPIDLDRDGVAESLSTLHSAWFDGYLRFFRSVGERLGYGPIMFGNPGYLSQNPLTLPLMNGWLSEVVSPYEILPNGDWNTRDGAGWYRLVNNYFAAGRLARSPQLLAFQFTGLGLGTQTGERSPNTWPARTNEIEARDYRRMRLGLTTTLLGDGFFEYDLVDNTTLPLWFDEFAVDSNGIASDSISDKGYLGQPLTPAEELPYPSTPIFVLDFETPTTSSFPGFDLTGTVFTNPAAVIAGTRSLLVTQPEADGSLAALLTQTDITPLEVGKTYQLFADYAIYYTPTNFRGPLSLSISDQFDGVKPDQNASLYMADVAGSGQRGSLRASVQPDTGDFVAQIALTDTGTVALDNIALVEGAGGVWRRDFENGVVLVNPTPDPVTVSLSEIRGKYLRTGVRRIQGAQVPAWNTGQAVGADGVTLPSADGIILLADRLAPGPPLQPAAVSVEQRFGGPVLVWTPVPGYIAGYHIRYGTDPKHLIREATSPAGSNTALRLTGLLDSGMTHYFQVAGFDFAGNLSDYSRLASWTTPEAGVSRPGLRIDRNLVLVPGARATLDGEGFSAESWAPDSTFLPLTGDGTVVLVNGVAAPLYAVSPTAIDFQVPWGIVGTRAVVQVYRDGAGSVERWVPVQPARPVLGFVLGFQTSSSFERAGQSLPSPGDVLLVSATGLGDVGLPPYDGTSVSHLTFVTGAIEAEIGGVPAAAIATLIPRTLNDYWVGIGVPDGLPAGVADVIVRVDGITSAPIEQEFTAP